MRLPFLDRERELQRLRRALDSREGSLVCVYGRRRVGKSRLLREATSDRRAVYYVGDARDAPLQRAALAREIAALVPGFGAVVYAEWEALLDRWWREAPDGAVLVLDEFPALVTSSPELPSILQKQVDLPGRKTRHLVLCGSSQRMMQGLLLDASAPLFGRARELLKLSPLEAGWIRDAFHCVASESVDLYAAWGGIPRYWELARDYSGRVEAVSELVLDPLGPLHREPERLLLDDIREVARSASILTLVGQGCHRVSEIASRLGVAATSLSRPLMRLVDLGFLDREVPFGRSVRDTKRTYYVTREPFLRLWYRFVAPNRSRLEATQVEAVSREVEAAWPEHVGGVWEDLARRSVARLGIGGASWHPASRWWGRGRNGEPLELDMVAEAAGDPSRVLVGEAKRSCTVREAAALLAQIRDRASECPPLRGKEIVPVLMVARLRGRGRQASILTADDVLNALR